jgi:hypothetical protein
MAAGSGRVAAAFAGSSCPPAFTVCQCSILCRPICDKQPWATCAAPAWVRLPCFDRTDCSRAAQTRSPHAHLSLCHPLFALPQLVYVYQSADQSSVEVVEQFGKFSRIAYPGGCFCLPGRGGGGWPTGFSSLARQRRTFHGAPAGFNFVWCCLGERVAGGLSLRIQQLDVRCETKTKVGPSCHGDQPSASSRALCWCMQLHQGLQCTAHG